MHKTSVWIKVGHCVSDRTKQRRIYNKQNGLCFLSVNGCTMFVNKHYEIHNRVDSQTKQYKSVGIGKYELQVKFGF